MGRSADQAKALDVHLALAGIKFDPVVRDGWYGKWPYYMMTPDRRWKIVINRGKNRFVVYTNEYRFGSGVYHVKIHKTSFIRSLRLAYQAIIDYLDQQQALA